jgi:16S rRNA (adenine1518-N6/adenine1519-N6)-dimethyltransferase
MQKLKKPSTHKTQSAKHFNKDSGRSNNATNTRAIQGHIPNKGLGQNFLQDAFVIQQIVQSISPNSMDHVIEIGPGLGALTHELLKHLNTLQVIEIDKKLIQKWQMHPQVKWIAADALLFDLNDYLDTLSLSHQNDLEYLKTLQHLKIIGNLPYHISSPLLFHYLKFKNKIAQQCFMLQKEVIDRMIANANHKDYGRLSIILQANYHMYHVLDVPPEAFFPPPKVHSSVVSMKPKQIVIDGIALDTKQEDQFNQQLANVTQICFSQRRKMLRAMFKNYADDPFAQKIQSICQDLAIDLTLRPENITLDQYLAITTILYKSTII